MTRNTNPEKRTCSSVGCELATVGGCDKTFCTKLLPDSLQLVSHAIPILFKKGFTYEEVQDLFPHVTEGLIYAILNDQNLLPPLQNLEVSDLVMLREVGKKTIHGEVTNITDNTITVEDEDHLTHTITKQNITHLSIGWC